jgi:hypothetical protein
MSCEMMGNKRQALRHSALYHFSCMLCHRGECRYAECHGPKSVQPTICNRDEEQNYTQAATPKTSL